MVGGRETTSNTNLLTINAGRRWISCWGLKWRQGRMGTVGIGSNCRHWWVGFCDEWDYSWYLVDGDAAKNYEQGSFYDPVLWRVVPALTHSEQVLYRNTSSWNASIWMKETILAPRAELSPFQMLSVSKFYLPLRYPNTEHFNKTPTGLDCFFHSWQTYQDSIYVGTIVCQYRKFKLHWNNSVSMQERVLVLIPFLIWSFKCWAFELNLKWDEHQVCWFNHWTLCLND